MNFTITYKMLDNSGLIALDASGNKNTTTRQQIDDIIFYSVVHLVSVGIPANEFEFQSIERVENDFDNANIIKRFKSGVTLYR